MGNYLPPYGKTNDDSFMENSCQSELKPIEKKLTEKYGYYLDIINASDFEKNNQNSIDIRISPNNNTFYINVDITGYCKDLTNFSKGYRNLLFNKSVNSILKLARKFKEKSNLDNISLLIEFCNKTYIFNDIEKWNYIIDLNYDLLGETKIAIIISSIPIVCNEEVFNEKMEMSKNWEQINEDIYINELLYYKLSKIY